VPVEPEMFQLDEGGGRSLGDELESKSSVQIWKARSGPHAT
jgi:hypothetical protein